MVAATPVDSRVNPNNQAQRYVLWGNGRIDNYGGALPITDGPRWFDRIDQQVGIALHITNWATPAGYVLDIQGGFAAFGGAPAITTASGDGFVNNNGLPYLNNGERRYADWSWNPNGSGEGYVIDHFGQLFPFGGATIPARGGPRFATPVVKGFAMRWTPTKAAYTLDHSGGLWNDWDAYSYTPVDYTTLTDSQRTALVALGWTDPNDGASVLYPPNPPPYFAGQDVARDLVVTDFTAGKGWVLTGDGAAHPFGQAPSSLTSGPYRAGQDVARELQVLSAADPVKFWQVQSGGQSFDYVASTPPTVTAGGTTVISPATTVTTTTRPVLTWAYSDPQQDSQAAWELIVFTQAFASGHTMTDPWLLSGSAAFAETGVNRTTRGITSPVDLPNGTYRMYVRAQDTAGQWSAWSNRGWTQNVPVPATPTGLTATVSSTPGLFQVALSVTATTGGSANRVRFEASDDAGATWLPVVGADAVPLTATTTAVDRFIPLGVTRTYRAVAYNTAPRTSSAPSATKTAKVTTLAHVLTAVDDAAIGGQVKAQEPAEWTRPSVAGVFQGIGADYPTVVSDGRPKARRLTLHLLALDRATWDKVADLAESDSVLAYRDPFGEVMFCRLVGDWARRQLRAAPTKAENTPLRHSHTTDLPLVEVRPPNVPIPGGLT